MGRHGAVGLNAWPFVARTTDRLHGGVRAIHHFATSSWYLNTEAAKVHRMHLPTFAYP
jgi:hypothetical protein